ncbi:acyl-CoA dehydrogenase NM domain-like protein [Peniophora sp. CONT]|nr:acyl-CoA dehydrogenase NM domain-like protein [Peniophora sp. CONT]
MSDPAGLFDADRLRSPPFLSDSHLPSGERARTAYERARAIALSAELELEDIALLRPKFWELHLHPVLIHDGAATTLITIQYNLVIGTLARYAPRQPHLLPLLHDLLRYRKLGQFMLTELGHGLDAENLETTATLLASGEFVLSTPSPQAAKFMPPTVPVGVPTVGVVFARLVVDGAPRGIRPFVVMLNDGSSMSKGVTCRSMPTRGGTNPVNHSLTSFRDVILPATALLGSLDQANRPGQGFDNLIWRVAVGSLALGTVCVNTIGLAATIGLLYSRRRTVTGPKGGPISIFYFRTQQLPILFATAQAYVYKALSRWATTYFSDFSQDSRSRQGVAAAVKAVITNDALATVLAISDRCGAQGLFEVNQFTRVFNEVRGIAIAEGDILVVSIRLATELLLGRVQLPPPIDPDSVLAQHERGIYGELKNTLAQVTHHRSEGVNKRILPRCLAFVEAIGHRLAYDAAVSAGVMPELVELFVVNIMRRDSAWYAEEAGLTRKDQLAREEKALDAVLPHVDRLVDELNLRPYVTAPIVSDDDWSAFAGSLQVSESLQNGPDIAFDAPPLSARL